jgi:RNA polymerase sigma-B factor
MATPNPVADPVDELRLATAGEEFLLRRYAESPTPELEAELIERFMPLARSLAKRYRGGIERTEDLNQVASLALVKALRGYDPQRGRSFKAYAAPTILGELRRHFRDHSWRLHMPRSLQEGSLAVERAATALADELGRTPAVTEIAERLGVEEEDVLDALQARESQHTVSLDAPVQRDETQVTMAETIGRDECGFDTVESQLAVERCAGLSEREREVVELRFVAGLNQNEIGDRIGISQMQVSRLLRRGLAKLLEAVQGDEQPTGRHTFDDSRRDPRFPHGRVRRRRRRSHAVEPATRAA